MSEAPRFDARRYGEPALVRARGTWATQAIAEERSAPLFDFLAQQVTEAGAAASIALELHQMAEEEKRHAALCDGVVVALGGRPHRPVALPVAPLAVHPGVSLEQRAARNMIYMSCLSEMIAVAQLVDGLDVTDDDYLRGATRSILADEVTHGLIGFRYLKSIEPWLEGAEARAGLERYLKHAFAVLEQEMTSAARAVPEPTEQELALGITGGARRRDVFFGTVEEAIVPGLERVGLGARIAWEQRAREATPHRGIRAPRT